MSTEIQVLGLIFGILGFIVIPRTIMAIVVGVALGGWWWVLCGVAIVVGFILDMLNLR